MAHPYWLATSPPNAEALGDAGWYFRDGDLSDLARQLSCLLADPQSLHAVGRRAKLRAEAHFNWDTVVERLEAVYDSLFADAASLPDNGEAR